MPKFPTLSACRAAFRAIVERLATRFEIPLRAYSASPTTPTPTPNPPHLAQVNGQPGYLVDEAYCGPITCLIAFFIFPFVCCCPCDRKQEFYAINQPGMQALGMLPPQQGCCRRSRCRCSPGNTQRSPCTASPSTLPLVRQCTLHKRATRPSKDAKGQTNETSEASDDESSQILHLSNQTLWKEYQLQFTNRRASVSTHHAPARGCFLTGSCLGLTKRPIRGCLNRRVCPFRVRGRRMFPRRPRRFGHNFFSRNR